MKEILLCNSEECVKLFKSTNRTQQLFICDMLIKNIAEGAELDLNIVDKLGRAVGVKITEQADEAISYKELWGER